MCMTFLMARGQLSPQFCIVYLRLSIVWFQVPSRPVPRTMYLTGLTSPRTAFDAAKTQDLSTVKCSGDSSFVESFSGKACISHNDASHTYWTLPPSSRHENILFALFKDSAPFTLRHCGGGHTGHTSASGGEIAYSNAGACRPDALVLTTHLIRSAFQHAQVLST